MIFIVAASFLASENRLCLFARENLKADRLVADEAFVSDKPISF